MSKDLEYYRKKLEALQIAAGVEPEPEKKEQSKKKTVIPSKLGVSTSGKPSILDQSKIGDKNRNYYLRFVDTYVTNEDFWKEHLTTEEVATLEEELNKIITTPEYMKKFRSARSIEGQLRLQGRSLWGLMTMIQKNKYR